MTRIRGAPNAGPDYPVDPLDGFRPTLGGSSSFESTAAGAASVLLHWLGMETPAGSDLERTPERMAEALAEMTAGLREPFDVKGLLSRTFAAPALNPSMILMRDIDFHSLCEHHVMPFHGTALVGYLPRPGARVVGASKLARLVTGLAAVPQMQERLGEQVIAAIMEHLDAQGAGCVIDATHTCLTLRGARSARARMLTSHLAGCFLEAPVRGEFLALARG